MAKQIVNVGTTANSGGGDPLRSAMIKINENFTEIYNRVGVTETQLGVDNKGGVTIQQSIIGDVIGADSSIIVDHTTGTITGKLDGDVTGSVFADDSTLMIDGLTGKHYGALIGDVTGSVVADDSTVLIDGVAGTISAGALTGSLPAIDGGALTNLTIPAQTFASLTSKPTTLVGYGITDAATSAQGALAASALQAETITLTALKTEVAASADFAAFKARIAAL